MKGRRKVDLSRLYYRILFSINSTVSWSEEGIDLLGNTHRTNFGGNRGTNAPGNHEASHHGAKFTRDR